MVKQKYSKGFTMIEMLLVLMFMSIFALPINILFNKTSTEKHLIMSKLIHYQYNALLYHRSIVVDLDIYTMYPVKYSPLGYINMGQTINIGKEIITLMITSGRVHEEG